LALERRPEHATSAANRAEEPLQGIARLPEVATHHLRLRRRLGPRQRRFGSIESLAEPPSHRGTVAGHAGQQRAQLVDATPGTSNAGHRRIDTSSLRVALVVRAEVAVVAHDLRSGITRAIPALRRSVAPVDQGTGRAVGQRRARAAARRVAGIGRARVAVVARERNAPDAAPVRPRAVIADRPDRPVVARGRGGQGLAPGAAIARPGDQAGTGARDGRAGNARRAAAVVAGGAGVPVVARRAILLRHAADLRIAGPALARTIE